MAVTKFYVQKVLENGSLEDDARIFRILVRQRCSSYYEKPSKFLSLNNYLLVF